MVLRFPLVLGLLFAADLLHCAVGHCEPTNVTELNVPFVISFERFGRHGEIEPDSSGAALISELSCTACHASDNAILSAKGGPNLSGVARRLGADWIEEFLSDPAKTKPGTTMPNVLHSLPAAEKQAAIEALSAFLATQMQEFQTVKAGGAMPVVHQFWKRGDRERGRRLYHTVGCVACHEPDPSYETNEPPPSAIDALIEQLDPEQIEEMGLSAAARRVPSIPHADLNAKYTARSLTMMLFDPARTRPDARMPSLRLSTSEAADITAYLLGDKDRPAATLSDRQPSPERIEQGRRLFSELRCDQCHTAQSASASNRSATPWAKLDFDAPETCLSDPDKASDAQSADDDKRLPRYRLDPQQLAAIKSCVKRPPKATPSNVVRQQLLQRNCLGCHSRQEADQETALGGVGRFRKAYFETAGHVDLGDEGRLPPPLTGVGSKLRPEALKAVFHPATTAHRPFMTIRMPAYEHQIVEPLLTHLPVVDHADTSSEKEIFGSSKDLLEAGRLLAGTGCVDCHPFGGESVPGVVGVDLSGVTQRLYPRYFARFVFNPGAVKERTRMPTFFPDGQSNQKELLGGDVDLQISALWYYLKNLQNQPLPEKIATARAKNYELIPEERPLVLRTFMRQVGTHAIAIGFPANVHYAFDAESVRPAVAWKGRFMDARGTWFERFAPPAEPLGNALIQFPAGPLLLEATEPSEINALEAVMGGYRLDADGVPTILYQAGNWQIEDRIEPVAADTLRRRLTIRWTGRGEQHSTREITTGGPPSLVVVPQRGQSLQQPSERVVVDQQGLHVSWTDPTSIQGKVLETESGSQWRITLPVQTSHTITLEYQW